MASMKEKAQCVLWYYVTKSPVTAQRKFRNEYGRPQPDVKSIKAWYSKFVETGSVGDLNRSGRPCVSDETVDAVCEAFQCSPGKSMRHASNKFRVPQSTVVKILHKQLKLYAYKVQIVQSLQPDDVLDELLLLQRFCVELMKTTIILTFWRRIFFSKF